MKRLIALLVALTMISTLLPMIASAEDMPYVENVYRDYDFDNTTNSSLTLADDIGGHSKVAKHPNVTAASSEVIMFSAVPSGSVTVLETDIGVFGDVSDDAAMTFFQYRVSPGTATSNRKACLGRNSSGNFTFMGADSGIPMNIGEWYSVTLTVPQVSGTSTLTVADSEGNEVGTYTRTSSAPDLARATFSYLSSTSALNYTYYDNFKVSYLVPPYTVTARAFDRNSIDTPITAVDYINPVIELVFSMAVKEESLMFDGENAIKLLDQNGNEIPFTGALTADGAKKIYSITPDAGLIAKATYTIQGTGVLSSVDTGYWNGEEIADTFELEFTVSKKDFAIENVVSTVSDGDAVYDVTIRNKTGENQDAYIVVAKYNEEQLVSVTVEPVTGSTDGTEYEDITLANLGTTDSVYLMSADGTFKIIDIWNR